DRTGAGANRWLWSYDRGGNRLSEEAGEALVSSTYNERNQLVSRSAGGPLRWRGTLNEPGNVTLTSALVNGKPARMLPGNVFEAVLDTMPGANTIAVQATDINGNVTTKHYQVTVDGKGTTYTYNANGCLLSKTDGTDLWRYAWNAEDQLVRVERNQAEV